MALLHRRSKTLNYDWDTLRHTRRHNTSHACHGLAENSQVGYPFDSGSHKMLWSRESIYQEANPEVTALARRGAA